jgi:hypothetical protein
VLPNHVSPYQPTGTEFWEGQGLPPVSLPTSPPETLSLLIHDFLLSRRGSFPYLFKLQKRRRLWEMGHAPLTVDRSLLVGAAALPTRYCLLGQKRDQVLPENVISGPAGLIWLISSSDAVPSHHLLFGFVPPAKRLFASALNRSVASP